MTAIAVLKLKIGLESYCRMLILAVVGYLDSDPMSGLQRAQGRHLADLTY